MDRAKTGAGAKARPGLGAGTEVEPQPCRGWHCGRGQGPWARLGWVMKVNRGQAVAGGRTEVVTRGGAVTGQAARG